MISDIFEHRVAAMRVISFGSDVWKRQTDYERNQF